MVKTSAECAGVTLCSGVETGFVKVEVVASDYVSREVGSGGGRCC